MPGEDHPQARRGASRRIIKRAAPVRASPAAGQTVRTDANSPGQLSRGVLFYERERQGRDDPSASRTTEWGRISDLLSPLLPAAAPLCAPSFRVPPSRVPPSRHPSAAASHSGILRISRRTVFAVSNAGVPPLSEGRHSLISVKRPPEPLCRLPADATAILLRLVRRRPGESRFPPGSGSHRHSRHS